MKLLFASFLSLFVCSCHQHSDSQPIAQQFAVANSVVADSSSYEQIKNNIVRKRKQFSARHGTVTTSQAKQLDEIIDFWVSCIGDTLYSKWANTPWDFNGTSTQPKQGAIACGYFVTTILRDMDLKINRVKLAICASSVMMQRLTPHQKIRNLSYLSYPAFNDTLKHLGKGVYIVGLDFHTGFIVNDGEENWFIHSNYIENRGVTKETVISSAALQSSKTRWLNSLTGDNEFIQIWLRE